MGKKGVVNIHGRDYKTVIMRVNEFREKFTPADGWAIRTWLIHNEGDRVIIQASICDKDDHVVATGFAEENRKEGKINRTSAIENCETSAIGRALAAFGLGGEEYCSADELLGALKQQEEDDEGEDEEEPFQEVEEPPKPKKRFVPKDEIFAKLELMAEKEGEEMVKAWLTMFLKHEPLAKGELSIGGIHTGFDEWKELYENFKREANRAFDMGFTERKKA